MAVAGLLPYVPYLTLLMLHPLRTIGLTHMWRRHTAAQPEPEDVPHPSLQLRWVDR